MCRNFVLFLSICLISVLGVNSAQAQCTTCIVQDSLCNPPATTFDMTPVLCGDTSWSYDVNTSFEESLTLYMPVSYTIRQNDPIPGLPIPFPAPFDMAVYQAWVEVIDVTGLPPGITWECDSMANGCYYQPGISPYGCIKLCGTLECEDAGSFSPQIQFKTLTQMAINGLPAQMQQLIQGAGLDSMINDHNMPLALQVDGATNLVLDLSYGGTSTVIDSGETITLTATTGFDSYDWSTGDTSESINVSPTDTTWYFVTVTDTAGCSQQDSLEIQVLSVADTTTDTTGILSIDPIRSLEIMPNPNQGIFMVKNPTNGLEAFSLRIFNIAGATVYTREANFAGDIEVAAQLEPGMYLVMLRSGNKQFMQKLIIN